MNKRLTLFVMAICIQLLTCPLLVTMVQETGADTKQFNVFPRIKTDKGIDVNWAKQNKDFYSISEVGNDALFDLQSQRLQSKSMPPSMLDGDPPVTVSARVVTDDDLLSLYQSIVGYPANWYQMINYWVSQIVEDGDDPFESGFTIDFTFVYSTWTSPDTGGNLAELFYAALEECPKPATYDVAIYITGQYTNDALGWCWPDGNAFIMTANTAYVPLANLWQHEASHLFYAPDHLEYCIMSYYWAPQTRYWCAGCEGTINGNRLRYYP